MKAASKARLALAKRCAPMAARVKLVHALLAVASYHVDRDDEDGTMGKRLVHYLARTNGIADDDPTDEALDLSLALASVAEAGNAMLRDVYLIAGAKDGGAERAEATASMAGTTVKHLRQIARALLLGADELERLADALGWSKGDDT